jgi:hypothetical protein
LQQVLVEHSLHELLDEELHDDELDEELQPPQLLEEELLDEDELQPPQSLDELLLHVVEQVVDDELLSQPHDDELLELLVEVQELHSELIKSLSRHLPNFIFNRVPKNKKNFFGKSNIFTD